MASSRWRLAGAVTLGAATAGVGYSIADDILLFRRCSRAALDAAAARPEFTELLGLPLSVGPWYNASLAASHGGRSLSSTFPVIGPHGTAMLHARMLRMKGNRSTLLYNLFGEGEWHLFALHANITHHELSNLSGDISPSATQKLPVTSGPVGPAAESSAAAPAQDGSAHASSLGSPIRAPTKWRTVHMDLLSPRGMPPLPSPVPRHGVCAPCEAQRTQAPLQKEGAT